MTTTLPTNAPAASRSALRGGPVSDFLRHHYRHFNAATLVDAATAYSAHLDGGAFESNMFPKQSLLTEQTMLFSDHSVRHGALTSTVSGGKRTSVSSS